MEKLSVSIIQSGISWENIEVNLSHLATLIQQAKGEIIALPEMFSTGFTMNTSLAEPPSGKTFQWMQEHAAAKNAMICGSFITRENNQYYNRFYAVLPDGSFHAYNKKHLFSLSSEQNHYVTDGKRIIMNYKGWKIAPFICYDLRFPVWLRRTEEFAYDLMLFTASWPERRSHAWKSLLVARAIENQSYVIGANRVGDDGNGIAHSGDSVVLDPRGLPCAAAKPFREEVLETVLDPEFLALQRRALPFLQDGDAFTLSPRIYH